MIVELALGILIGACVVGWLVGIIKLVQWGMNADKERDDLNRRLNDTLITTADGIKGLHERLKNVEAVIGQAAQIAENPAFLQGLQRKEMKNDKVAGMVPDKSARPAKTDKCKLDS
jgi:hypothetical protein